MFILKTKGDPFNIEIRYHNNNNGYILNYLLFYVLINCINDHIFIMPECYPMSKSLLKFLDGST